MHRNSVLANFVEYLLNVENLNTKIASQIIAAVPQNANNMYLFVCLSSGNKTCLACSLISARKLSRILICLSSNPAPDGLSFNCIINWHERLALPEDGVALTLVIFISSLPANLINRCVPKFPTSTHTMLKF